MPISFFRYIKRPTDAGVKRTDPPAHLRNFVEGFYRFNATDLKGTQLLFNDGFPVVVIMPNVDARTEVIIGKQPTSLGAMWLCGGVLKETFWQLNSKVDEVFVVRFKPATFHKLFNITEDYFQTKPVSNFSEIAGAGYEFFLNSYYQDPSLEKQNRELERFISAKACLCSYPAVLNDMLSYITKKEGKLPVKELLDMHGVRSNYKWLERNFKKHLGISPQKYILLQRFINAYLHLDAFSSHDLLDTAITSGYCDDNHLIKDFRRYVGSTPKAYFGNKIPAATPVE